MEAREEETVGSAMQLIGASLVLEFHVRSFSAGRFFSLSSSLVSGISWDELVVVSREPAASHSNCVIIDGCACHDT